MLSTWLIGANVSLNCRSNVCLKIIKTISRRQSSTATNRQSLTSTWRAAAAADGAAAPAGGGATRTHGSTISQTPMQTRSVWLRPVSMPSSNRTLATETRDSTRWAAHAVCFDSCPSRPSMDWIIEWLLLKVLPSANYCRNTRPTGPNPELISNCQIAGETQKLRGRPVCRSYGKKTCKFNRRTWVYSSSTLMRSCKSYYRTF
jgi:hypothetical protein